MTYGYCRISTKKQSLERQVRDIKTEHSDAVILQEAYTGKTTTVTAAKDNCKTAFSMPVISLDSLLKITIAE